MFSKEELKAAEKQAIEGLVGAARAAAKKAFYEANKAAIRAANNAEAVSKEEARTAPELALVAAAAAKGLNIAIIANTGFFRGSSYDTAVLVTGNTFGVKDVLKSRGATWNGAHKAWVFNGTAAFQAALNAL